MGLKVDLLAYLGCHGFLPLLIFDEFVKNPLAPFSSFLRKRESIPPKAGLLSQEWRFD